MRCRRTDGPYSGPDTAAPEKRTTRLGNHATDLVDPTSPGAPDGRKWVRFVAGPGGEMGPFRRRSAGRNGFVSSGRRGTKWVRLAPTPDGDGHGTGRPSAGRGTPRCAPD